MSMYGNHTSTSFVGVAQLVEHGTHKPGVASSILAPDTKKAVQEGGFRLFMEQVLGNYVVIVISLLKCIVFGSIVELPAGPVPSAREL